MEKECDNFDVIVIGGGPAGLSAGIIASHKGLRTAVFEGGTFGGLLSTIYPKKKIFNYPGTPRIRADHLVSEWVRAAAEIEADYILWDEPHFFGSPKLWQKWWCCRCNTCKKLYQRRYGREMPLTFTKSVKEFRGISIANLTASVRA